MRLLLIASFARSRPNARTHLPHNALRRSSYQLLHAASFGTRAPARTRVGVDLTTVFDSADQSFSAYEASRDAVSFSCPPRRDPTRNQEACFISDRDISVSLGGVDNLHWDVARMF
jgi:hypothetical protein